jgi:hypothetical protein
VRERTRLRGGILGVAVLAAMAMAGPTAEASFHEISIREVYPGSVAQPESSYVELQMYSSGQEFVGSHGIDLYNASGAAIDANGAAGGTTLSFGGNLTSPSVNQQTILIGDSGVQAAFGVTPDLANAAFNIPAAGGAACWAGSIDCVAWGSFTDSPPPIVGTPVDQGGGIPNGMALKRKITGGSCTNLLDSADDTNDSASDFSDASPAPVSYATVPPGMSCTSPSPPPTAIIDTKPPAATNSQSATFTFHSSPAGATFECRIDSTTFDDCNSGTFSDPGPIPEGSHTFQVKATNANGTGPTASYTWRVDLTAPTAIIDTMPPSPSSGRSPTFTFHAPSESATFECSMVSDGDSDVFSACSSPKTYPSITSNGSYVFKVRARDSAQNQGAPASYRWTVDTSLLDVTPPIATIQSRPPDPSQSSTAAFTYSSNEPGSAFECKLDSGAFAPCAAGGIQYTGLANGAHNFQVRATDTSLNQGASVGYSWSIAVPDPTQPPPVLPRSSTPPDTKITGKPGATTRDRTPTFRFQATITPATFECKLDGAAFKVCRSPFTTKTLTFGRHTVKFRATAGGLTDSSPAKFSFKVAKRKAKRR